MLLHTSLPRSSSSRQRYGLLRLSYTLIGINTQKDNTWFESASDMWYWFSQSQHTWVQEPRLGMKLSPHTIIHNYPLTGVLFSIPFHLCSFDDFGSGGRHASIRWQTVASLNWKLRLPVVIGSFLCHWTYYGLLWTHMLYSWVMFSVPSFVVSLNLLFSSTFFESITQNFAYFTTCSNNVLLHLLFNVFLLYCSLFLCLLFLPILWFTQMVIFTFLGWGYNLYNFLLVL